MTTASLRFPMSMSQPSPGETMTGPLLLTQLHVVMQRWPTGNARNLFKVPSDKVGASFVKEITRLIRAYTEASALESVVLKAVMIMPHLLLQKSHRNSKYHVAHLERRLKTWTDGDISQLLHEGRTIQSLLFSNPKKAPSPDDGSFPTVLQVHVERKGKSSLRLITTQEGGGTLPLDKAVPSHTATFKTVRDILHDKHPPPQPFFPSAICGPGETTNESHPVFFDRIDGTFIRNTVLRMDGSAGPSGMDTAAWKRMCTSFRSHSSDLCDAIASLAKRMCTSFVDPLGLEALVACKLIALDKCPGGGPSE